MAQNNRRLEFILDARDNVSSTFRRLSSNINAQMQQIRGSLQNLGNIGIAGLGGIATAGLSMSDSLKTLELQTGATGQSLIEMQNISKSLFSGGLTEGLDGSVQAVSFLKRELNLTGDELKNTAQGGLLISKVFGKDINETLRSTTALVKNYGITGKEASETVFAALQNSGDQYDDLLDSINEYSSKTKESGLNYKEFVNILIQGTKNGVRNTDELADSLRESSIRQLDGSDKTRMAFKKLGIDYNKNIKLIQSGQKTSADLMKETATAVLNIDDKLKQTAIGTDLFGTKFEDNGFVILKTLSNTNDYLKNTNGLIEKNAKLVDKGMGASWNKFKLAVGESAGPLAEVVGKIGEFMSNNKELTGQILKWGTIIVGLVGSLALLNTGIGILGTTFTIISGIIGGIATFLGISATLLGGLVTGFIVGGILIYKYWDKIRVLLSNIGDWIRIPANWLGEKLGIGNNFGNSGLTGGTGTKLNGFTGGGSGGKIQNQNTNKTAAVNIQNVNVTNEADENRLIKKIQDSLVRQDQLLIKGIS